MPGGLEPPFGEQPYPHSESFKYDVDRRNAAVGDTHKDLITALAYLDIADRRLRSLPIQVQELRGEVREIRDGVRQLQDFLGVIVPNWRNRNEIEQGDDMGILIPSADAIGLIVEIVPLQLEPGFEHEEVVSMEPPAGTLVARGSTVRVRMNFTG